jgi:hypothetical protein
MSEHQLHIAPGALHIHTHYSPDCNGLVPDIVAAARRNGLQWIIITDHNSREAHPYAGWNEGVFVVVGNEITPPYNHLLALDVEQVIDPEQSPQAIFDELYQQGGLGIIAHPDDCMTNKVKRRSYEWQDWSVDGPSIRNGDTVGIEVWNLFSDWGTHLTPMNKYVHFFFIRRGLRGPTQRTLAWWDRLNMSGKRTFGVAGVDAHAMQHRAPWGGTIEVFSYQRTFATLTNYLLLDAPLSDDNATAHRQLHTALRQGRLYFANRLDGDPPRLPLVATRGSRCWHVGDSPSLAEGTVTLTATTGPRTLLRLMHNGSLLAAGTGSLRHRADMPGVYRLEACHHSGRPWLYTNPIYLRV